MPAAPSKVAYLGASFTRQEDGYRPRLHEMLERRLGRPLEHVAAGLGAMDAASIVFLTDEFVTSHGPDLCFVEVTSSELVADRGIADGQAALDGIFAKLRRVGCAPSLLHLPRRRRSNRFDELLTAYESVAERHGVPSIDPPEPELSFRDARLLPVDPADGGVPGRFRLMWPLGTLDRDSAVRRSFTGNLDGIVLVVGPGTGEIEVTDARGAQRVTTRDRWSHYDRYGVKLFSRRLEPGEVTIAPTENGTTLRLIGYLEVP